MLRLLAMSLAFLPTAAQASSIVTLEPSDGSTPSITRREAGSVSSFAYLGNAFESEAIEYVSPSVIAMGEPAADQQVSSVGEPEKPRWQSKPLPMVIRGGLVGSAFSTPQRSEEAVPREAAEAAPEPVDATEEAEEFENGEDFEE